MSLRPAIRTTQHRGHTPVTGPETEPVTVAQMKDLLNLTGTADDNLLTELIAQARNEIEEVTGIAMLPQTWRLSLDRWPGAVDGWWSGVRDGAIGDIDGKPGWLNLPRYPLATVDSVTVYNQAGTGTAVTVATVFSVDTYSKPGRMALKSGQAWPVALRQTNAIVIEYEAGYADAAFVPDGIKRALKSMTAHLYSHRGDGCSPGDAYAEVAQSLSRYMVARL